jgi:hypothetical protein
VTGLHAAPAAPATGFGPGAASPPRPAPATVQPGADGELLPCGLWLAAVPATAAQLPAAPPGLFLVHLGLAGGEWVCAGTPVDAAALADRVRRCGAWQQRPLVVAPGRPPTGGFGDALPASLAGLLGVPVYVADGSIGLLPERLVTRGRFWRFDPAVRSGATDVGNRLPETPSPFSPPRTAPVTGNRVDGPAGQLGLLAIPDVAMRWPAARGPEPQPAAAEAAGGAVAPAPPVPGTAAAPASPYRGSGPERVERGPGHPAGQWQPVTASVTGDGDLLRARLGWRFGVAARAVTEVLAERPGLRRVAAAGDRHAQLIGLRAYLVEERSAVDEVLRGEREAGQDLLALARLAAAGLRLLPVAIGPAFLTAPAPAAGVGAYRPGDVLVEPCFVGARHRGAAAAAPDRTIRYVLLSSTGRQVQFLVPHSTTAVLFAAGTHWRVLAVGDPDETCAGTVYLGEMAAKRTAGFDADERALKAMRAAAADADWPAHQAHPDQDAAAAASSPRQWALGLDRDGQPIADQPDPASRRAS